MAGRRPKLEDLSWLQLLQLAADARDKTIGRKARNLVKTGIKAVQLMENAEERYIANSICEGMLAAMRKRFMRAELMLQFALKAAKKAETEIDRSIFRLVWTELGVVKLSRNKCSQAAQCFENALELIDESEESLRKERSAILEKLSRAYTALRCDVGALACRRHLSEHDSSLSLSEKLHSEQVLGVPAPPERDI